MSDVIRTCTEIKDMADALLCAAGATQDEDYKRRLKYHVISLQYFLTGTEGKIDGEVWAWLTGQPSALDEFVDDPPEGWVAL